VQGGWEYQRAMSRKAFRRFAAVLPLAFAIGLTGVSPAAAKSRHKDKSPAPEARQSGPAGDESSPPGKPSQLGTYGDWNVYLARGEKTKTCYALATPKERTPGGLNRDPAYVFISNRPGENVRHEVSVIMGFPLKEDGAHAEVAGSTFALIAKGTNAWIKNPAEEGRFIDALKKASKLTVKAASVKGRVTTDSYSLTGLSQALERVEKECP
jgi:invasion protein IalB